MISDQVKIRLAWGLCLLFAASAAATSVWLYREGSRICENLVANLPSEQASRPCALVYRRESGAPVDRRVSLDWRGASLERVRFSSGDGESNESTADISCSTMGRIALPLVHFRHWLTISVLQNLGGSDAAWRIIDRRIEQRGDLERGSSAGSASDNSSTRDRDEPSFGPHARRVRGFDADGDGALDQIQASTRQPSGGGQVYTHRYFEPSTGGKVRHTRVHRDASGAIVAREILRARQGPPSYIEYRYDCGDR